MDYQKRNASVDQVQGAAQQKVQAANAATQGVMNEQKTQPLPEAKNKGTLLKRGQDGKFVFDEANLKALIDNDFKTAYTNENKLKFNKTRLLQKLGFNTTEFDKASINAFAEWQESVGLRPTARYDVLTRKTDFVLEMAEAAEKAGTNNPVLAAGQGMLESGYSFRAGYNQGGVKANQTDIANGKYTLEWTTERLTQSQLEATKTKVDNDPKRSYHPRNPGHKYMIIGPDNGKTKISIQDYFKTFDTLEDYLVTHGATVKNIVTKFVSESKYRSKFYEPDASKREAKIAEILANSTKTLECIQSSGINSGNYATAADYAETVGPCVRQAQEIIDRAAKARARANGNTETGAVTGNATNGAVITNSEHEDSAKQDLNSSTDKTGDGNPQSPEIPTAPAVEYPNINVADAIKYNTRRNPGMLEYLQTYLGIAKTNEYDEITVKSIAKWQEGTKGKLVVDGKFGDKSYEYALSHGLKELMPTMLDEVVITGKKGGSSANDGGGSAGGDADRGVEEKPKEEKPKEVKPDEPDPAGLYTGTELIGKNSSNRSAVKTIQYYLKKYGFEHGAEGKMDHKTFLNVMYYQFTRNLSSVDGEVGTTSWGAFRNDPGKVYEMDDTIGYSGGKSKKITLAPIKDANNKEWKIADKAVESFNNLHNKYKSTHSGKGLAITSTYRAMTSAGTKASKSGGNSGQIELYANYKYGIGGQALAAKPGTSNHQSGIAIDFAMDTVKVNGKKVKDANGRYKIQDSSKPLERWLIDNGPDDKFYNIKSEPWHYDYKG